MATKTTKTCLRQTQYGRTKNSGRLHDANLRQPSPAPRPATSVRGNAKPISAGAYDTRSVARPRVRRHKTDFLDSPAVAANYGDPDCYEEVTSERLESYIKSLQGMKADLRQMGTKFDFSQFRLRGRRQPSILPSNQGILRDQKRDKTRSVSRKDSHSCPRGPLPVRSKLSAPTTGAIGKESGFFAKVAVVLPRLSFEGRPRLFARKDSMPVVPKHPSPVPAARASPAKRGHQRKANLSIGRTQMGGFTEEMMRVQFQERAALLLARKHHRIAVKVE